MTAGSHHFFVAPGDIGDHHVVVRGTEAHHAVRVLRVKVGETISVADGGGRVADAVVTQVDPQGLDARVIVTHELRPQRPELVMWQGLAKREAMEVVVQKAVELGARRVVPFSAQNTVVRWDEAKRAKALKRWTAIALGAAKQCRSPWLTEVEPVRDGLEGLESNGVVLALHERSPLHFRDALPLEVPDTVTVVVGPEGGLTEDEVHAVKASGGVAVTMGARILRTETAGPVALALTSYAYGVLG